MSHEIRTPMNAILGFTQLLRSDAGLTAAHRETLDTIARSGEHLLALIDDVLEMSRIESGKAVLAPSEFDLNELVETVESMFRVRVEGKGLRFTVSHLSETRRSIIVDKGKLRQILVNLIGNAVKFTTHGSVELRVGVERNGPGGLTLHAEVLDTGPGISVQEQDRLFRYFEQTTAGLQSGTGTGLGLAICREYVTLMGGVIGVESQLGQGSAFHFHVSVREHRGGAEIDHEEIVESSDALAAPSLRMDSLSQDFVGELRQAALSADIDRILRWVGEAERLDPRLARRVRELAQQFDYPALLDLSGYEEEA
jgi:signal transduction histidine kinase